MEGCKKYYAIDIIVDGNVIRKGKYTLEIFLKMGNMGVMSLSGNLYFSTTMPPKKN